MEGLKASLLNGKVEAVMLMVQLFSSPLAPCYVAVNDVAPSARALIRPLPISMISLS